MQLTATFVNSNDVINMISDVMRFEIRNENRDLIDALDVDANRLNHISYMHLKDVKHDLYKSHLDQEKVIDAFVDTFDPTFDIEDSETFVFEFEADI